MAERAAQLSVDGQTIDLAVLSPSEGYDAIDISALITEGYVTFDPGFMSTASCESSITYIDGDEGILLHRGYPIEQLSSSSNYLELTYLLLFGSLPTQSEFDAYKEKIRAETYVDDRLLALCATLPQHSHPMGIMCSLVGAMSAIFHHETDITDAASRDQVAIKLIAQMPICAAIAYRHSVGKPMLPAKPELAYGEHFLHLMFSEHEDDEVNPVLATAMDRIFLLHADHEQNASTSTVRLAGSTDANPYASIAAGIAALWGPSHGGANEAVLDMLAEMGSVDRIEEFVGKAKDSNDPFRLMGFGHRVYKNYDPRAKVMQQTCDEVLNELGVENDPVLQMARELERIALADDYFVQRRLYPNVDFYSGIILKAIGMPVELFTVIFVTGRTSGWIAQWKELVSEPYKIGRPRQMYTGSRNRDYVPIGAR
ncbi:MAG: citrate synthase [Gammaproteobacteria bacterium]|nr:citrate synthase [Gammaproteobacteria bacterium]